MPWWGSFLFPIVSSIRIHTEHSLAGWLAFSLNRQHCSWLAPVRTANVCTDQLLVLYHIQPECFFYSSYITPQVIVPYENREVQYMNLFPDLSRKFITLLQKISLTFTTAVMIVLDSNPARTANQKRRRANHVALQRSLKPADVVSFS